MFTSLPPRYQALVRTSLSSAWVLMGLGGAAAMVSSPLTIVSELGTIVSFGWGLILATAAIVAGVGVATNRYRIEWPAAWFAASGLSIYAITLWWLVFTGGTSGLTQAFMVSAAVLFMVTRALFCAAHAAKLRTIHSGETGPTYVSD